MRGRVAKRLKAWRRRINAKTRSKLIAENKRAKDKRTGAEIAAASWAAPGKGGGR